MQAQAIRAAMTALHAAYAQLAACGIDTLTRDELVAITDDLEILDCQLPSQRHRLLARLQAQASPQELGAKSWRDVVMSRWRLSSSEANRRLTDAALLGPRQTLSGEPMPPLLPATATAQGLGLITQEHVTQIRKGVAKLPGFVDTATRTQIEVDWVRHAAGTGPKQLADEVARQLFLLDQDGPAPDETERARRRGISKGPQQPDGMTHATADFTPEAWATLEALFAKYAAPGMCNPADEHPCTSGTPTQEQIDADTRSLAQRRHDALAFVARHALDKTELGQHNGLPTTIIVRTTLQDLESRAGIGVTGGGTLLPISDVVNLAARADTNHYLAVFDQATGSALDLFRARRTASVAQRLMLIARDGGCTKPSCTVPAYGTQVHHATLDWTFGGLTNVNDMALACGPDNRMVGPEGWTTRINEKHEVEWIPPPGLDTGQTRTNRYHQPEKLHPPPADAWTPPTAADEPSASGPPPTAPDGARDPHDPPVYEAPPDDDERVAEEPTPPDRIITAQDWIDAWTSDEPSAPDQTCRPHDPPVYEAPPDDDERAADEPTPPDRIITAQDWIDAWTSDEPPAPDQTCRPHDPPVYEAPPDDDEPAGDDPSATAPHDARDLNDSAANDDTANDGPEINGDNTTRQSGPDRPGGKAA